MGNESSKKSRKKKRIEEDDDQIDEESENQEQESEEQEQSHSQYEAEARPYSTRAKQAKGYQQVVQENYNQQQLQIMPYDNAAQYQEVQDQYGNTQAYYYQEEPEHDEMQEQINQKELMCCLKFVGQVHVSSADRNLLINLNYSTVQSLLLSAANMPSPANEDKQSELQTKNYAKDLLEREIDMRLAAVEINQVAIEANKANQFDIILVNKKPLPVQETYSVTNQSVQNQGTVNARQSISFKPKEVNAPAWDDIPNDEQFNSQSISGQITSNSTAGKIKRQESGTSERRMVMQMPDFKTPASMQFQSRGLETGPQAQLSGFLPRQMLAQSKSQRSSRGQQQQQLVGKIVPTSSRIQRSVLSPGNNSQDYLDLSVAQRLIGGAALSTLPGNQQMRTTTDQSRQPLIVDSKVPLLSPARSSQNNNLSNIINNNIGFRSVQGPIIQKQQSQEAAHFASSYAPAHLLRAAPPQLEAPRSPQLQTAFRLPNAQVSSRPQSQEREATAQNGSVVLDLLTTSIENQERIMRLLGSNSQHTQQSVTEVERRLPSPEQHPSGGTVLPDRMSFQVPSQPLAFGRTNQREQTQQYDDSTQRQFQAQGGAFVNFFSQVPNFTSIDITSNAVGDNRAYRSTTAAPAGGLQEQQQEEEKARILQGLLRTDAPPLSQAQLLRSKSRSRSSRSIRQTTQQVEEDDNLNQAEDFDVEEEGINRRASIYRQNSVNGGAQNGETRALQTRGRGEFRTKKKLLTRDQLSPHSDLRLKKSKSEHNLDSVQSAQQQQASLSKRDRIRIFDEKTRAINARLSARSATVARGSVRSDGHGSAEDGVKEATRRHRQREADQIEHQPDTDSPKQVRVRVDLSSKIEAKAQSSANNSRQQLQNHSFQNNIFNNTTTTNSTRAPDKKTASKGSRNVQQNISRQTSNGKGSATNLTLELDSDIASNIPQGPTLIKMRLEDMLNDMSSEEFDKKLQERKNLKPIKEEKRKKHEQVLYRNLDYERKGRKNQ